MNFLDNIVKICIIVYNDQKYMEELSMDTNVFAAIAAFSIIFILLGLVLLILLLVTQWKIFSKAGRPGWEVIIPIYNNYIRSKIVFGNLSYFIGSLVVGIINVIGKISEVSAVKSLGSLGSLILYILYCINVAKVFRKSGGFTVGLIFLPVIFFPILAFGRDEYIGPENNVI